MNATNSAPSSVPPLRPTTGCADSCCRVSAPAVIGWALIASSVVPFMLATRREGRTQLIVGTSLLLAGGAVLAARRISAQR